MFSLVTYSHNQGTTSAESSNKGTLAVTGLTADRHRSDRCRPSEVDRRVTRLLCLGDPVCLCMLQGDPIAKAGCRMDLPGPTTLVGTRTDYSVGPWDYPACAARHLMAWSTRTTEEKYSVRKLYMSCTVRKTPRRTRLVLSPYSDL
jgi:hypothetical protein